jgi:ATP-dependent exoDNAse (exonuclease V) beta subunit
VFLDPTTCYVPGPVQDWQHDLDEQTEAGGHRTYRAPDGARLTSVTTLIKATTVDGPQLVAWRERLEGPHRTVAEAQAARQELLEAEALRDEGAERGKVVHDWIERFLVARQTRDAAGMAAARGGLWWRELAWAMRQIDHLHATELAVYHRALGYAGRLDGILTWCGTPVVVDWKTKRSKLGRDGKVRRPKREWLLHHHDQIVAYIDALAELGVTVNGEPVQHGVLVVALGGTDRPVVHELGDREVSEARERLHDRLDRFYLGAA